MRTYKGFTIYTINQGYRVQTGYDVIGTYKTIGGAKRAITCFVNRQTVEKYAYKNTSSSAGLPQKFDILVSQIRVIKCWFNMYGNPSYCFHMESGDYFYLVDDYGAMNGLSKFNRVIVDRKKDLFKVWS